MPVNSADHWRERARTTHIKADEAKQPRTKHLLRGLADSYERLAKRKETGDQLLVERDKKPK
jgi:hypothetical protein